MYILSCESTADLTLEYLVKRDIPVIAYSYTVDGKEYPDDMHAGNGLAIFYNQLTSGKMPSTSLINVERYLEYFRSLLAKGDVLHVAFSSALSHSAYNAIEAAEQLKKEFPNRKIYVVDSLGASVGYGLLVDSLADLRDKGATIDEAYEWAETNKMYIHSQFFSTTLTYFRRSGRISNSAAIIGNLLRLCPIMRVNKEGKIIVYAKVMSETKAINRTLDDIAQNIRDGADYDGKLWIGHSNYLSSATKASTEFQKCYPKADIRIFDIGPVVASHCGPGTLAVFFMGALRA